MIKGFLSYSNKPNYRKGSGNIVSHKDDVGSEFIVVYENEHFDFETKVKITDASPLAEVIKIGDGLSFVHLETNVGKQYTLTGNATRINELFDFVKPEVVIEEEQQIIEQDQEVDKVSKVIKVFKVSKVFWVNKESKVNKAFRVYKVNGEKKEIVEIKVYRVNEGKREIRVIAD